MNYRTNTYIITATLIVWTWAILTHGKSDQPYLPAEEYIIHMMNALRSIAGNGGPTTSTATNNNGHGHGHGNGNGRGNGMTHQNSIGSMGRIPSANRNGGLVMAVQRSLAGCRWELLQEAYVTLGKVLDIDPEMIMRFG